MLVGGLEHDFYDFPYIGNFIIPTVVYTIIIYIYIYYDHSKMFSFFRGPMSQLRIPWFDSEVGSPPLCADSSVTTSAGPFAGAPRELAQAAQAYGTMASKFA